MNIVCEASPEVERSTNIPHRLRNSYKASKITIIKSLIKNPQAQGAYQKALRVPHGENWSWETHTPAAIPMPSGTPAVLDRPPRLLQLKLTCWLVVASTTLPSTSGSRAASISPPAGEKSSKVSTRLS